MYHGLRYEIGDWVQSQYRTRTQVLRKYSNFRIFTMASASASTQEKLTYLKHKNSSHGTTQYTVFHYMVGQTVVNNQSKVTNSV